MNSKDIIYKWANKGHIMDFKDVMNFKDIIYATSTTSYKFEDLLLSDSDRQSMTQEQIDAHNDLIGSWSSKVAIKIIRCLEEHRRTILYFEQRYKKDRKDFWKYKEALLMLLKDTGVSSCKITTGFKLIIGSTVTDLFSLELHFDDSYEGYDYKLYYRVYTKPRQLTAEEQEQLHKENLEKREKEEQKRWKNNCYKWSLPEDIYDRYYIDKKTNDIYQHKGCYPRNKKMPIRMRLTQDDTLYSVSLALFKRLKALPKSYKYEKETNNEI